MKMETMFQGIFDNELTQTISVEDFLLCLGVSLGLGLFLVLASLPKNESSKSYLITLFLLPAVVCVVIMMVNGNVGAGVAVAGAFSLVRFRSAPGSAKEIVTIFLAMGAGLLTGMGYLGFAVLFTAIMSLVFLLSVLLTGLFAKGEEKKRVLKITIPEDLDYTGAFDDLFSEYTAKNELVGVKTLNLGSLFRLTYQVTLKDAAREKEMLDRIRERNGNLEVFLSKHQKDQVTL